MSNELRAEQVCIQTVEEMSLILPDVDPTASSSADATGVPDTSNDEATAITVMEFESAPPAQTDSVFEQALLRHHDYPYPFLGHGCYVGEDVEAFIPYPRSKNDPLYGRGGDPHSTSTDPTWQLLRPTPLGKVQRQFEPGVHDEVPIDYRSPEVVVLARRSRDAESLGLPQCLHATKGPIQLTQSKVWCSQGALTAHVSCFGWTRQATKGVCKQR